MSTTLGSLLDALQLLESAWKRVDTVKNWTPSKRTAAAHDTLLAVLAKWDEYSKDPALCKVTTLSEAMGQECLTAVFLRRLCANAALQRGETLDDWRAKNFDDVATLLIADAGPELPGPAGEPYRELAQWAAAELKGKQRRAVELLAEKTGRFPMSDLATDPAINWEAPYDNQFNGLRKAVNQKLRKIGWRVFRQDNEARMERVKNRSKMA